MLQLSELDRLAESEFLDGLHLSSLVRFLAKFLHDLPETLNTKIAVNELKFPLVTHTVYSNTQFDSYRLLKSGHGAEQILDRLDIQVNSQILGHKKCESWQGLVIDCIGHLLSFPTPTRTHIFGNHGNGYSHLSIATCGVQRINGNSG
jgi:hypothetical protein